MSALFPDRVCAVCVAKVEEVYNFWDSIKQNETFLSKCLSSGKKELYDLEFKDHITRNQNLFSEHLDIKLNITLPDSDNNPDLTKKNKVLLHRPSTPDFKEVSFETKSYPNSNGLWDNTSNLIYIKTEEGCDINSFVEDINFNSEDDNIVLSSLRDVKVCTDKIAEVKTLENRAVLQENDFKCLTCLKMHSSYEELLKHYLSVHSRKKKRKVDSSLYTVQETNDGHVEYQCLECKRAYVDKRSIVSHVLAHSERPEDREFKCNICGRTYGTVHDIARHGRVHADARLHCSYKCGFSTAYKHALRDHEKRHRAEYKYRCEQCGRGFLVKTWYEQHQNVHSGDKPYACHLCGRAFHMQKNLTSHLSGVHAQGAGRRWRFACPHCSAAFDNKTALTHHLHTHGKRAGFLCTRCGRELATRASLAAHERSHAGLKPHTCKSCNKSYSKKFSLVVHERSHASDAPAGLTCPRAACTQRFTQRSALTRHLRRKHGSSPEVLASVNKQVVPDSS